MNIRAKLTIRFILITAIIFLLSSVLIYILSADYREDDFYQRLYNKAFNTAKLLIEVEEVDATLLRKIEHDNPVSLPNEKIVIYNYRDSLLFTTDESIDIVVTPELFDKIRIEDEVRFIQGRYEVLGFLFKGEYDRFVVIAAATDIYGFRRLKNLIYILGIVFAISIVIVSISGWIYSGRALQPIARVVDQVSEISISSLNLRVDEGNQKDEIARLGKTFNNMLARLETSFLTQKNFIANASHELRTPLTIITGQLEVILMNTRSLEEYKAVLESILDDIRNLNLLSNRLLVLAQTSSEERKHRMIPIRVDELIWQVKEDLEKCHAGFVVSIDINDNVDDEHKLTINGDEQLMKTAISNIIENGCKYSENKTTHIFIESKGNNLVLRFRDNGIGIPPEEFENIFQPFYRASNTKTIKGHGIGLSLVKAIVRIHQGTINISSRLNEGTSVILVLPHE